MRYLVSGVGSLHCRQGRSVTALSLTGGDEPLMVRGESASGESDR